MKSKSKIIIGVLSIAILLVSLALLICELAVPFKVAFHPVLDFVLWLFIGFGIMTLVLGITRKSPAYLMLAGLTLGLSALYLLVSLLTEMWYLGVICTLVIWLVIGIFSLILNGNRTEAIALNKSPEYKNYETRKAEKEAAEASEPKKELPEIKSFKD